MNAILSRWATPLTLGLFAVSAVSGLALFLHIGQSVFHEMHEWLSVVLLAPFVLHMVRNWTPLLAYVRRRALLAPLALSLAAALAFAFVETMIDKSTKALAVNWDDELVKATCLTRGGAIVHPNFQPKTA